MKPRTYTEVMIEIDLNAAISRPNDDEGGASQPSTKKETTTMRFKQQLLNIIEADAEIRQRYIDNKGQTCAIGGIGKALGVDMDDFFRQPFNVGWVYKDEYEEVIKLRETIMAHFHLTADQVSLIQRVNDSWPNKIVRHQKLRALIESWEEEDGTGAA